ncbi:MAG TPA: exopolyphosphatase [Candidatus Binatia bacterium]|nr:exopolyphosphatase [Candidatus Binatia bacterium]
MRLVTRADFDGLVCGAVITLLEDIDAYLFVEPKFMQDGQVEIRRGDVIANLPYHPNTTLWFDHHVTNAFAWRDHTGKSEEVTLVPGKGGFRIAPSAARVVYEYYTEAMRPLLRGDAKKEYGLKILDTPRMKYLLEEADKIDAALLTPEDVLHPAGYVLISMTIDGKYPEDEPYWLKLIDDLRDKTVDETMQDPEVKRRCGKILADQERMKKILLARGRLERNVVVVDLRGIDDMPEGNRFLLYTLFPSANISVKVAADSQRVNTTAISVGYNIFNPTSNVNVGALLKNYGGGGHKVVGSCRVPNEQAEQALREIVAAVREG